MNRQTYHSLGVKQTPIGSIRLIFLLTSMNQWFFCLNLVGRYTSPMDTYGYQGLCSFYHRRWTTAQLYGASVKCRFKGPVIWNKTGFFVVSPSCFVVNMIFTAHVCTFPSETLDVLGVHVTFLKVYIQHTSLRKPRKFHAHVLQYPTTGISTCPCDDFGSKLPKSDHIALWSNTPNKKVRA